jgi:hypothetical protein
MGRVRGAVRGSRCFEHYRLRVLLNAAGVTLAQAPQAALTPNPLSPLKRHGLGLMPGGAGQWRSTTVNVVRVVRLSPAGKQSFTRSGAKPSQWGSVNVQ